MLVQRLFLRIANDFKPPGKTLEMEAGVSSVPKTRLDDFLFTFLN